MRSHRTSRRRPITHFSVLWSPIIRYSPFTDPAKVDQYAAMAQAEGVSLPVAQRLLKILQANARRQ
jgi:hypothetical protein